MSKRPMKYNPAFLTEEELVEAFVVRQADLELIVGTLRENTGQSNQHMLIIGPRGMGKTMFVLRTAAEVRRDTVLNERWYPLVFAEESYEVTTPGEFWLEALFHLGRQTGEERWSRAHEELLEERDEGRLQARALAQLLDFADQQGKRILLIVENLNMLLGEQLRENDAWTLRHTLLNEPRLMLLATATTRFEQVDNGNKAFFELFKLHELKPLELDECKAVWRAVTGLEPIYSRIRPIQILTGGSPRLLTIVASFAADLSFRQLMDDLLQLVDDHTEYFKSHLDSLAPKERKVYVTLADLWEPSPAKTVANAARMNVNEVSALLNRLMERGAVSDAKKRGRTKYYQVAERMYNIYYLMRRRGEASSRVRAVVDFMISFYGESEIPEIALRIAEEACRLAPKDRHEHYLAFADIARKKWDKYFSNKVYMQTPPEFFNLKDINLSYPTRAIIEVVHNRQISTRLDNQLRRMETVLECLAGLKNFDIKRLADFIANDVLLNENDAGAWLALGTILENGFGNYSLAEKTFRIAINLQPDEPDNWCALGNVLRRKQECYHESMLAYRKAIELNEKHFLAWDGLISLSFICEEEIVALDLVEESLQKCSRDAGLLCLLVRNFILNARIKHWPLVETWAREGVQKAPNDAFQQYNMALLLCVTGRGQEALGYAKLFLSFLGENEFKRLGKPISLLFSALAGVEQGKWAVETLSESMGREHFESIIVALRLYLGEEILAPVEVLEMAKDIINDIETFKKTYLHPNRNDK